jgi:hypothetical protein
MAALLGGFPVPTLSPVAIKGKSTPSLMTLYKLQSKLNQNAMSVPTERCDGMSGHLVLTCPPAVFLALPRYVPFTIPANPGQNPTILANATNATIRSRTATHFNNVKDFQLYLNTDATLKQQLLKACPNIPLKDLLLRPRCFYDHVAASYTPPHNLWSLCMLSISILLTLAALLLMAAKFGIVNRMNSKLGLMPLNSFPPQTVCAPK